MKSTPEIEIIDDRQEDDEKEVDHEDNMNDFAETFVTQFRPFDSHGPIDTENNEIRFGHNAFLTEPYNTTNEQTRRRRRINDIRTVEQEQIFNDDTMATMVARGSPRCGRNTVGRRSRGRGRPAGNRGMRGQGSSGRGRRGRGSRRGSVSRTPNVNVVDVVDNEATDMTIEELTDHPEEADITVGVDINVPGEKRKRGKQQYQSCRQHYAYRIQQRVNDDNILVKGRKLFQQFCCDMYIKIEGLRLKYIRTHQSEIRAEEYDAYQTEMQKGTQGGNVGTPVILPSSFTGGPRYQTQLYQDAMALVRKFGKPDFFVTMTANPKWVEITRNLLPGQTASDRFDLIERVFNLKFNQLRKQILYKDYFGKVACLVWVIEWQKRGNPHVHMLIILKNEYKYKTPEQVDQIISAEIPDRTDDPELHNLVTTLMMHGPCGEKNPDCVCMENNH